MRPASFPRLTALAGAAWLACGAPADAPQAVPHRTGVVELEIGELDGAGPGTFARIAGLAPLAGGRLLVLDGDADEARVFSQDGQFEFAFGRQGAGPGEFSDACCVGLDSRGRVWIRDGGNARYDVFIVGDTSAEYRFSVRMGHGDVNFWAPITFDDRGRIIDIGHRPDGDGLAAPRRPATWRATSTRRSDRSSCSRTDPAAGTPKLLLTLPDRVVQRGRDAAAHHRGAGPDRAATDRRGKGAGAGAHRR